MGCDNALNGLGLGDFDYFRLGGSLLGSLFGGFGGFSGFGGGGLLSFVLLGRGLVEDYRSGFLVSVLFCLVVLAALGRGAVLLRALYSVSTSQSMLGERSNYLVAILGVVGTLVVL